MIKKNKNTIKKQNMANMSPQNKGKDRLQQFEIQFQRAIDMALDLQNLGYFPTHEAAMALSSPPAFEFMKDQEHLMLLSQIQPICDRLLSFHEYREEKSLEVGEWLQSKKSIQKESHLPIERK